MDLRIGIDTGGTFTDLVAVDEITGEIITSKMPSTPSDPIIGILETIHSSEITPERLARSQFIHGTTVLTNCLIERKGARINLLITKGFQDIPYIQRINRKFHYDLQWEKPIPLVRRRDTLGVAERLNYKGEKVIPLTQAEIERVIRHLKQKAKKENSEAVAVCFLFSYVNAEHEKMILREMKKRFPEMPISVSHRVAPIWREYERVSTTLADAYVKPLARRYINNLERGLAEQGLVGKWSVMKSNGGIMDAGTVPDYPVNILLSGPAGGVIASQHYGQMTGVSDLVTIDMGGTSADVALISNCQILTTTDFEIEWGLPVIVPALEISTIGAGGGSIGWVDKGGLLHVGPQSAGSEPGPACYDRGGSMPTITDANLALGRLSSDYFLGGKMELKVELAWKALEILGHKMGLNPIEAALAMVEVADENMASTIRLKTIQAGLDPRKFSLIAFGGAGPLHACSIARKLGMRCVMIPPHPGVFSALGLLLADLRVDKVWTKAYRSDTLRIEEINEGLKSIKELARSELKAQGYPGDPLMKLSMSMRVLGQNYELEIEVPDQVFTQESLEKIYELFHKKHEDTYGYAMRGEVIELISFNASAIGVTKKPAYKVEHESAKQVLPETRDVYLAKDRKAGLPIFKREALTPGSRIQGPAIIEEPDSTTFLVEDSFLEVDRFGVLMISLA
ncbi:MAG: hydantoinase/oxoprolinase family protein [Deltaproteobacteria bacterium]|nr:hydantoinase/oxoprolinase family protein [Deltaproteobacteria bacterium]